MESSIEGSIRLCVDHQIGSRDASYGRGKESDIAEDSRLARLHEDATCHATREEIPDVRCPGSLRKLPNNVVNDFHGEGRWSHLG